MRKHGQKMNVALLSRWHVHSNEYAQSLINSKNVKITAVWDEDEARGRAWAEELGCNFYKDYNYLLRKDDVDAVVICSPTNMHTQLIIKAAKAGKHIFTEKALSIKYSDALKIKSAVDESGVKFVISFPHKTFPTLLYTKQCLENNTLGRVSYARVRMAHNGSSKGWLPEYFYNEELCGGGAMIDLGAHPMYTLEWLLGKPLFVQSSFTDISGRGVEDNAVSVIEFENGAVGVSETGFVSQYNPYTLEISGDKGFLRITDNTVEIATDNTNGKLVRVDNLPEHADMPIKQWLNWCEGGAEAVGFGIDDAVRLTSLTYCAYKSARTKSKIYVEI